MQPQLLRRSCDARAPARWRRQRHSRGYSRGLPRVLHGHRGLRVHRLRPADVLRQKGRPQLQVPAGQRRLCDRDAHTHAHGHLHHHGRPTRPDLRQSAGQRPGHFAVEGRRLHHLAVPHAHHPRALRLQRPLPGGGLLGGPLGHRPPHEQPAARRGVQGPGHGAGRLQGHLEQQRDLVVLPGRVYVGGQPHEGQEGQHQPR
mmetsp:Transcript_65795/g.189333  ORF Transcript_65795/g.189333 Transcript_65795/m.189333 type:complete len:201 (-) Transcript_65795:273-875(-)